MKSSGSDVRLSVCCDYNFKIWLKLMVGGGAIKVSGGVLNETDTNKEYIKIGWKLY